MYVCLHQQIVPVLLHPLMDTKRVSIQEDFNPAGCHVVSRSCLNTVMSPRTSAGQRQIFYGTAKSSCKSQAAQVICNQINVVSLRFTDCCKNSCAKSSMLWVVALFKDQIILFWQSIRHFFLLCNFQKKLVLDILWFFWSGILDRGLLSFLVNVKSGRKWLDTSHLRLVDMFSKVEKGHTKNTQYWHKCSWAKTYTYSVGFWNQLCSVDPEVDRQLSFA